MTTFRGSMTAMTLHATKQKNQLSSARQADVDNSCRNLVALLLSSSLTQLSSMSGWWTVCDMVTPTWSTNTHTHKHKDIFQERIQITFVHENHSLFCQYLCTELVNGFCGESPPPQCSQGEQTRVIPIPATQTHATLSQTVASFK